MVESLAASSQVVWFYTAPYWGSLVVQELKEIWMSKSLCCFQRFCIFFPPTYELNKILGVSCVSRRPIYTKSYFTFPFFFSLMFRCFIVSFRVFLNLPVEFGGTGFDTDPKWWKPWKLWVNYRLSFIFKLVTNRQDFGPYCHYIVIHSN